MKKNKFIKNYFKVFDKNGYILFSILGFGTLLIIYSIFFACEPLSSKEPFFNLSSWYKNMGVLWAEPVFDIYVPFISSIILCISFFKDYNNNVYEIMTFYNRGEFNSLVFSKWILYTTLLMLIGVLSSVVYYRNVIADFNSFFVLLLRFIPPILYMNAFVLIVLIFCKNIYISISLAVIYITIDLLSSGRYLKFFTLYCNSFYLKTLHYFYINRILLFILSFVFVLVACKKAVKL